jgi:hypothetical protein
MELTAVVLALGLEISPWAFAVGYVSVCLMKVRHRFWSAMSAAKVFRMMALTF